MLAVAALILALALCGQADFVYKGGVTFTGNVTLAAPDSRFNYHSTSSGQVNVLSLYDFFWFKNTNAQSTSTSNSQSGSADGIVAVGYAGIGVYPSVYACYYNVVESISVGSDGTKFDASGSAAFVGKVFSQLLEVDANGNTVKTYDLYGAIGKTTWSFGSIVNVDPNTGLSSLSWTASAGSATIAITFTWASVLGKVTGGATLTPTSVETYFEVNGYTLASSTNHLRLIVYTGHLSASAAVSGSSTLVAGSGPSQIYIRFNNQVSINGNNQQVTITGLTDSTVNVNNIPDASMQGFLSSHGSLTAEVRKVAIDFPQGQGSLSYDPAIGYGAPNSSAFLAPSILAVVLAAFLALFA